ncbi:bifunctional diguanylate cyclase/phosphodiesterase [Thioalkalivibrio sp. ALgr3]|uniref:putative bifunctional diguanylate cyclase/phosphodiesterase n=1 Tax=Thioalkalivibrio sp. ALgr3 TaxID=1239292 RepID=UPI000475FEBC|nr:EAL domain-containing protein [Thioalkalivibrio sp. ALgr3]
MQKHPDWRDTWPIYLRYTALAVAIVAVLAVVQVRFVYAVDGFPPQLFVIPSAVGLLFGIMLARIRVLASHTHVLRAFAAVTAGTREPEAEDDARAFHRLLEAAAGELDSDEIALFRQGDTGIERLAHWARDPQRPACLIEERAAALCTRGAEEPVPRSLPGQELELPAAGRVDLVRVPIDLPEPVVLAACRRGHRTRRPPDPVVRGFLGLCAEWLGMRLERRHQQAIIDEQRARHAREQRRAQTTLASICDGVLTVDTTGRIDYANPMAARLLHQPVEALTEQPLERVLQLEDQSTGRPPDPLTPGAGPPASEHGAGTDEQVLRRSDGSRLPVQLTVTPVQDTDGTARGHVIVLRDVSEVREALQHMAYYSSHDDLTGLINRRRFEQLVEEALHGARSDGRPHVLCYLDLDQFKLINDTRGHQAGDEMLRQIAGMLRSIMRPQDHLARLGGDEFGILMQDCDIEQGSQMAVGIASEIAGMRFFWEDNVFALSASLGVVPVDSESESTQQLLRHADTACYAAKDSGRNQVRVYTPQDVDLADRAGEMHWVSRIPQAIERGEFELWAQPVLALDDGPPAYQELLLRLRDEHGNPVPPGTFIPAAERYDLMCQLDRWVVETALEWMQDCQARGAELPVIGINISGTALNSEAFPEFLLERVRSAGIPGHRLCFEITETAAVGNLTRTARFMRELRGEGCLFALDDFGSGLSSFAYLKNLPVDFLKVDGSFVKDIEHDPIDLAMVRAIHDISGIVGLTTIAEHVENEHIGNHLRALGIPYGQGYGLAMPAPLAACTPSQTSAPAPVE